MPKRQNLNTRFPSNVRTKRARGVSVNASVTVVFDEIESTILQRLSEHRCHYVALMAPYLSNKRILKACSTLAGVSILTNYEKAMRSKVRTTLFNDLTPLLDGRVKTMNAGRGRNKTLLHTKAMILLDATQTPYCVLAGSWNFTENSSNNLEQITMYDDAKIAASFYEEFTNVWGLSKAFL